MVRLMVLPLLSLSFSFEEEEGRISSLEMILKMLNTFPDKIINENATYIFIPLTLMLSNDESVTCRKTVAVTLKTLLAKVSVELQTEMLELVLTWLQNDKVGSRNYLLCKVWWNPVNKYLFKLIH